MILPTPHRHFLMVDWSDGDEPLLCYRVAYIRKAIRLTGVVAMAANTVVRARIDLRI